jgi:outer membrane protein
MKNVLLFCIYYILIQVNVKAQSLKDYIIEGLNNNIVLKEKAITVDKALIALKEANSYFLPSSGFETQYTRAKGGRSIDIPVGSLLNAVYKTLNTMTRSDGFPQLKNLSEQLLPDNFYDMRLKTVMPIFNPSIKINSNIKKQEIVLQENDMNTYRRQLVKDIKVAYYNFLMASEAIKIFESALKVARQSLRASQSLAANGKALPAYVTRTAFEIRSVEGLKEKAFNDMQNARAYFNFLLNKPLHDTIMSPAALPDVPSLANLLTDSRQVSGREELKGLTAALNVAHEQLRLKRTFRIPRLNSFLDMGMQDFNFKVNNKSFFYLAGLQVQVPIFAGKRNLYQIHQAALDADNFRLQWEYGRDQLKLAIAVSLNNLRSAYSNYTIALNQQQPAKEYYFIIEKGYREGVNSFLEFLDASRQLIETQLMLNINKFKVLSAVADYERETASFSFSRKN